MAGELDIVKRRQIAAATKATEVLMDQILGAAQRIVPLEEGTLAGSADRETNVTASGHVEVVGYFATPYARRQHEELTWQHRDGRQAKYLEVPFKERAHGLERIVGRAVAAVTR